MSNPVQTNHPHAGGTGMVIALLRRLVGFAAGGLLFVLARLSGGEFH
jgi:hypothetical protein